MNYLVGAYSFGIVVIAGYVIHLVRQARSVAARMEEVEEGGLAAG